MKKFLSAITLSIASFLLIISNSNQVFAFDPNVDSYEDLFYETIEISFEVLSSESAMFDTTILEISDGTYDALVEILEIESINYKGFTLNGIELSESSLTFNSAMNAFILTDQTIGYYMSITSNDSSVTSGFLSPIEINDEFVFTFELLIPWTQSYSYGRVRSYDLDLAHQPGMTYDAANERVWVGFEDESNLNFDVRNFDEGNYSEFGIVAAWQSPYKNFRVVNAAGTTTIEEWEDVAAVVFQPHTNGEPDPRGSSTLTVYYWVDGEIVTDTLDDLDLERAYFYGGVRQAITGEEHMVANVDDLVPLEDFLQYITAWDDIYGDISDQIYIVDDDGYEPDVVGVYNVIFGVKDAEAQESTLEVSIHVVDIVAPVITGVTTPVTISYNEEFNVSAWVASLTVSDNYYTDLTIQIKSNTYSSNKTNIGTYQITVRSFDPSGNEGTLTRTINVVDGVGPVFTGPSTITTSVSEGITVSQIIDSLAAVDDKDGNVTNTIVVDSDGLTGNATIPGTYDVVFRAEDAAGNQTFHTVTVSIVSAPPKFYLIDGSSIRLLPGANLTIEQIIQLLGFTEEYSLLSTNYDMNTTGHYTMTLSVDGQILTFNIFVLSDGDPALPVPVIPSSDSSVLIWTIVIVSAIIIGAALFLVPKIIRRRNQA